MFAAQIDRRSLRTFLSSVAYIYAKAVRSRVGYSSCFFFQAEDGIRDYKVTGVQTCALPIFMAAKKSGSKNQEQNCGQHSKTRYGIPQNLVGPERRVGLPQRFLGFQAMAPE